MPMPKPKKNEEKQDFVSRCIADVTRKDKDKFPTVEQRAAICYSEWGETPNEKEQAMAKKKAVEYKVVQVQIGTRVKTSRGKSR